jgi:hypothetical protein
VAAATNQQPDTDSKSSVSFCVQMEIRQKSKMVILHLNNQAAINDQALLAAMLELESPASTISRDVL